MRPMKRCGPLLSLLFCIVAAAPAQTRRALIVGIDTYQPTGTTAQHEAGCTYGRCELGSFENLEGAVNDAQSIADVLTGPKFGFPADMVVLLTNPAPRQARPGIVVLPAAQTTHDGILAAMKKYIDDVPQPGDTVVFYFAGHGSLRVNTAGEKLTVRGEDGKLVFVDSTLVPADVYKGGYDIRDREMTRILNAALDKGVHLTVIFDSCHSGGATRGLAAGRQRSLPYDPRPVTDPPDTLPNGQRVPPPTERADNPALVFAAVQQDQAANEANPSENMPESHGAFTAALLETLQVLPADAPASLVYQRVKAILEGGGFPEQEPDLDANPTRRAQPLFGGAASQADADKVRTAALKVDADGSVWLDIGMVSGIGPGSEFTATTASAGAPPVKLRIDKALGVARSSATIVNPTGAKVRVGDVFELTRLMPAQSSPLRFWIGPANLSSSDIATATTQIAASGVATIADPAEEPYTDVLSWNGSAWTLRHAAPDSNAPPTHTSFNFERSKNLPVNLGAQFSADALKSHLTPKAKLWVDLPASREMAAKLNLGDANSEAQATTTPVDANYILAGSIAKGAASYAWFHKNEFATPPHSSATPDHSPGCSATSPYPVRSDWVPATDAPTAAQTLNAYSTRLAKVHGWLELSNNAVAGASESKFFNLAFVPMTTANPIDTNTPVHENDRMRLALQASAAVKDPRWVYILDIDCHGKGTLIYPRNDSENQYPGEGDQDSQVILRHAPTLRVGPPFGVDTMILLTTAQPLPDPDVLNFDGVARGATRGAQSPLQQLLSSASSGSRGIGAEVEVPTNWGIETKTLRSLPKDATVH
jgi:hypothetical protein